MMNASLPFPDGIRFLPEEEPALRPSRWTGWRIVRWILVIATGGAAIIALSIGIVTAIEASHRARCDGNLKRLGLAFHEYHEAHGHFPAPAIMGTAGTPLLSWRVALLPHLGYQSLYARFRLNEPWDSPHNRSLLAEMPPELACPGGGSRRQGQSEYRVIVGPSFDPYSVNTPFDSTRGVEIREMTDGTSNTVLVVETETAVPWTKPDDLRWVPKGPLPELKNRHRDGPHVLFADGRTQFLKQTTTSQILLALLTVNGGEVFGGG